MRGVALTSLWVAAWRAAESERPDALFHDPFARALAGAEGFEVREPPGSSFPIGLRESCPLSSPEAAQAEEEPIEWLSK